MTIQLTDVLQCEWCGGTIHVNGSGIGPSGGRPRKYCSHLCRDAAYDHRKETTPGRNEKLCPNCYLVHAGECI